MDGAKLVVSPLVGYFKLTEEQSPKNEKDQVKISKIPSASVMDFYVC